MARLGQAVRVEPIRAPVCSAAVVGSHALWVTIAAVSIQGIATAAVTDETDLPCACPPLICPV